MSSDSNRTMPRVPRLNGKSKAEAAVEYAKAGWFVLPVKPNSGNNPGSYVGKGWHKKSSNDPEQVRAWWERWPDAEIAGHVGRSGLVAFDLDVDSLDVVPEKYADPLRTAKHQRSRRKSDRGHYVFRLRRGEELSNSPGGFRAFGEVRGRNGIIMLRPSSHLKGGRYHWTRGPIPMLPDSLRAMLREAVEHEPALVPDDLRAFLDTYTASEAPKRLKGQVNQFRTSVASGVARHEAILDALCWAFREAFAGVYPAQAAYDALAVEFEASFRGADVDAPSLASRRGSPAPGEFERTAAYAAAQALVSDPDETRKRMDRDRPAATEPGITTLPDEFFPAGVGLDAAMLAGHIEALGPIATGPHQIIYWYEHGLWLADGAREVQYRTSRLLGPRFRTSYAATAVKWFEVQPAKFSDEGSEQYLNVPNGLLDWRTGQLIEHDPDAGAIPQLPVEWHPEATCPAIDAWLRSVLPDDCIELAYEVMGYALYNGNPLHKAVMLFGSGRNGKGTFLRLLERLIGYENRAAVTPQQIDDNRFMVAELYRKLANIAGDVDPKKFQATENFKKATGQDAIQAERKHGQPFTFECRALMIAAFNAMPQSADTTEGFFSRWVVLPFSKGYFPAGVADSSIEDKLHSQEELEGLLVASVDALRRVIGRGRFSDPQTVQDATRGFRVAADPIRQFLSESTTAKAGGKVKQTELYTAFEQWAHFTGYKPEGRNTFYGKVREAGADVLGAPIEAKKSNGVWQFRGLALRPGRTGELRI